MKFLIIGKNNRFLAQALKQLDFSLGVVDYYGYADLISIAPNCFSVLKPEKDNYFTRTLHRPLTEYLYKLAKIMIEEQGDFDGILLGNGFYNEPEIVEKFFHLGPKVYGNEAHFFNQLTIQEKLIEKAKEMEFQVSNISLVNNSNELQKILDEIPTPFITTELNPFKERDTNILWKDKEKAVQYFLDVETQFPKRLMLRKMLNGFHGTATVLSYNGKTIILSISKKLFNCKDFHAPQPLFHTGEIVPYNNHDLSENQRALIKKLSEIFNKLFSDFSMVGISTIDFLVDEEIIYINRILPFLSQVSECIQLAVKYDIIDLHIKTIEQNISKIPKGEMYSKTAIESILFVPQNQKEITVKKYPERSYIADKNHLGVKLQSGDPLCSIIFSKNKRKGIQKLLKKRTKITYQKMLKNRE
jgi:predicted ATP-grasp superfamily ATP-dependent carboligase